MKILLSFSNQLISTGINCVLAKEKNIDVFITHCTHLSDTLKEGSFDILVLDIFVLDRFLSNTDFKSKVLLVDTGCDVQTINYALIAGHINGVIEMNSDGKLLLKACRMVMKDNLWISKNIMKQLVLRLSELSKLWNLKSTDVNILSLLGKGMDSKLIAKALGTKINNVRFRINHIQNKSDVTDRHDLINLSKLLNVFYFSEIDQIH